jgi:alpha-1,2-mannosyltransferase
MLARAQDFTPDAARAAARWLRAAGLVMYSCAYAGAAIVCGAMLDRQMPNDLDIYLAAALRAVRGEDAYQPFGIGSSFIYPPTALLLFAPLAQLDAATARLVWLALSLACFALAVGLLLRDCPPKQRAFLILLVVGFGPVIETLSIGQVNTIVLLGLALFIEGYRRPQRRWRWLGDAALAAAILIKISPLVLIAYPILRGDIWRCVRLLVCVACAAAASVLFVGPQAWLGFGQILPELFGGFHNATNQSPGEVLANLSQSVTAGPMISAALVIGWLCAIFLRKRSPVGILAMGVLVMTLASSLVWYHHLTFLLLPILLLLVVPDARAEGRWWWPAVLLAILLIQLDHPVELLGGPLALCAAAGYTLLGGTCLKRLASAEFQ